MHKLDNTFNLATATSINHTHDATLHQLDILFTQVQEAIAKLNQQTCDNALFATHSQLSINALMQALSNLQWDVPFLHKQQHSTIQPSSSNDSQSNVRLLDEGGSGGAVGMPKMLKSPPTLLRCGSPFNVDEHPQFHLTDMAVATSADANHPQCNKPSNTNNNEHPNETSSKISPTKISTKIQCNQNNTSDVNSMWSCIHRVHESRPSQRQRQNTPPFSPMPLMSPHLIKPTKTIDHIDHQNDDDISNMDISAATDATPQYINTNRTPTRNKRLYESAMMATEVPPPNEFPSDESTITFPTTHRPGSTPTNTTALPSVTATDTPTVEQLPKLPTDSELADFVHALMMIGSELPSDS